MSRVKVCDNCGKALTPSNPWVAKLFLVPMKPDANGRRSVPAKFNGYTAHMDIGQCCVEPIVKGKRWQKRKSEPQKGRRKVATSGT